MSDLTSLSICSVCKFIKHHDKSCNPFRPELLEHTPVLPLSAVIDYEFFAGRTIMHSVVSKHFIYIQKPSRHTCQLIESIPVKVEVIVRSEYTVSETTLIISYKRTHYSVAKTQTHFLSPDPISLILILHRPSQESPYTAVYVSFAIVTILNWSIVGPALGQHGVNIVEFTKQFNAKTADQGDLIIPVVITVYADRSFSFITKTPPAPVLIKKACKIKSGSGEPNKTKVAKITKAQVQEIAELKMPDLNAANIEAAMSMIAGTARSMGVEVVD